MTNLIFQNLPEQEPREPMPGDIFLAGSLVDQKELKQVGDHITYYVITGLRSEDYGKVTSFEARYDILEN